MCHRSETNQLNKKANDMNATKTKISPTCGGEGELYEDTSRQCTVYRNECCGGCGFYYGCEACNGTGEVEDEGEDEDE